MCWVLSSALDLIILALSHALSDPQVCRCEFTARFSVFVKEIKRRGVGRSEELGEGGEEVETKDRKSPPGGKECLVPFVHGRCLPLPVLASFQGGTRLIWWCAQDPEDGAWSHTKVHCAREWGRLPLGT